MSSELRFEHIENKIREASENIPYAFDENAWEKMEAKLDEKDKRRPFFWLWLLLPIFLAAGWLFVSSSDQQKNNNNIVTSTSKNVNDPSTSLSANTNNATVILQKQQVLQDVQSVPGSKNTQPVTQSNNIKVNQNKVGVVFASSISTNSLTMRSTTSNTRRVKNSGRIKNNDNPKELATNKAEKSLVDEAKTDIAILNATPESEDMATSVAVSNDSVKKEMQNNTANNEVTLKKDSIIQKDNKIVAKKSTRILSKFYVVADLGGEISSVKLMSFNSNPVVAKYGFSIGYEFNKKIAAQMGVFMGNKKYVAGTNDYNIKQGSYLSMVNITSIDANCAVYEIPLSVRYNFLNRRSFSYYTAVGVTSFIMKNEDYNYHYKRYNSILTYPYSYTGNQHLFSNMQFAFGIQKKINNRLAIQMEPSFSIPLSGVGEGKVKLYETNLQLGIQYHPFK
jgi:hypothetical protein